MCVSGLFGVLECVNIPHHPCTLISVYYYYYCNAYVCLSVCRYLVDHDPLLPTWHVLAVAGVQLLGYWIFRSANSEKDAFRSDPSSPAVSPT